MNPYPGLRPFRREEAALFNGREIVLNAVATRVRVSPLTVLVARSGVGKSSFLTCRLIPELSTASSVRYRNEWGSADADELIDAELTAIEREAVPSEERSVLVLDQFEDVFKMSAARDQLWDRLAEVVNVPDSSTNILVSMREEWLGAWGETADYLPSGLQSLVRLAPLSTSELTRAIIRPAEIEGSIAIEGKLVDELVSDLKRPNAFGLGGFYVEPGLLQLVCHTLWNEAATSGLRQITVDLYERLGRADRIAREFVWRQLGRAGSPESEFDAADRVLWVGMTRHLVVAQGIKAIADPTSIARKLRIEDLGFAGPAVVHKRLPKEDGKYLAKMPERRGEPPETLVKWIVSVVDKGVQVGFLKQQHGLSRPSAAPGHSELRKLFEISHDSLSDLFQQFCVEFESWVRWRWAKLMGVVFGLLFVLPFVVTQILTAGLLATLALLGLLVVALFVYVTLILVVLMVAEFLFRALGYPIVRRLARGTVPIPVVQSRSHSKTGERIRDLARRLGFLPR